MKNKLIYLLVILFAVSCSTNLRVEKRRYTKGYYVELKEKNNTKNNPSQSDNTNTDTYKTVTELAYYTIPTIKPIIESNISQTPDGLIASLSKVDYNKLKNHVHISPIDTNNIVAKKPISLPFKKSLLKKVLRKNLLYKENSNSSNKRGLGAIITGITLLTVGGLIFFLIFWQLGVLLLLAGLITLLVGTILYSRKDKNIVGQYQETIYLKNGSIIKGSIIEQVVDDYVKVQMKDGNIMVYKMTDVEKIVKEKVSN